MVNKNTFMDSSKPTWKRRPSEIRGYQRTLYFNSENGDYLRVDYNLAEKRIRLYMEIDNEGGNAYYAVISNGKITAEKSVSTGRTFGFADKFKERSDIFSTIPNRDILKLINRNYDICGPERKLQVKKKSERQKRLEETRQKYFKDDEKGIPDYLTRGRSRLKTGLKLVDLIDFTIGCGIAGGFFVYYKYSFVALGVCAAFYGIITGMIDMFFRNRSPQFIKILPFLICGIFFYLYGYFTPQ